MGITSSNHEKFLGVLIDSELNIDVHIKNLESRAKTKCSCQNKQLPTLDQKLILINSAIKPQFSYCPLICRTLWIILANGRVKSFQDILEMTDEKTIHKTNLDCLAKEIYKFLKRVSSPIINNIFKVSDNTWNLHYFHLHKLSFIYSTSKKTVKFGHETITYRGPKILKLTLC